MKKLLTALVVVALMATTAAAQIVAIPRTVPGADPGNTGQIFLYSLQNTKPLVTLPAIPETRTNDPSYSAFNKKGELFVGNRHSNVGGGVGSISRFLVDSKGKFTPNGTITGNGLEAVHGVAVSPKGELFASNILSGVISRFVFDKKGKAIPNGTFTAYGNPQGLAFNSRGELFINDVANTVVKRFLFDPVTGVAIPNGEFAVPGASGLHGLTFNAKGELFVASIYNNTVFRFLFDAKGTPVENGSFTVSGGPLGLAFSQAGELFVTGHLGGGISRFSFDKAGNAVLKEFTPTDYLGGVAIY
jgi:sugar lactone lactonase YvrE